MIREFIFDKLYFGGNATIFFGHYPDAFGNPDLNRPIHGCNQRGGVSPKKGDMVKVAYCSDDGSVLAIWVNGALEWKGQYDECTDN